MQTDPASRIETIKTIAHPIRLSILEELSKGVKCVSDFEDFLQIKQPIVSQQLAALRNAGIIDFFVDGRLRCYFLKDPIVLDILHILKKDYPDKLPGPDCCPDTKRGTYPGKRKK